jgi:hypothetical protein
MLFQILGLTRMLYLWLIILSVVHAVYVNNEAHLLMMTSWISRLVDAVIGIGFTCVWFIWVSARAYISICVYIEFLKKCSFPFSYFREKQKNIFLDRLPRDSNTQRPTFIPCRYLWKRSTHTSIILFKQKSKCHMAPLRSCSMDRNSYINQRKLKKKEKSRPSIYFT